MNGLFLAILAGFVGMVGWGLSDFFSAKAMKKDKLSESVAMFCLYLITSIVLWFGVFATHQSIEPITFSILTQLTLFAIINLVAYLLFFHALNIGNLSTISTLFSTYAIGSAVISFLFFGEQTNITRIIALVIVFIGVIGVSIQNIKNFKVIKGLYYVIPAAILLAIFFPFFESFLAQHNGSFYWTAVIDSILSILFLGNILLTTKKKNLKINFGRNITFSALFNSFAILGVTLGLKITTLTSIVIIMSSAVPLVSATLGYFVFKEKISKHQLLGIIGILIGTALLFGS